MKNTRFYVLFCLFLVANAMHCTAQPGGIVPFPYTMEKQVKADSGIVVTAHPLATQVGLDVLRAGGNAVDAAVAVHFALAVVYPQAGNIGGGGFLVWRGTKGDIATLDFREKAPAAATEKMYQDSLGNVLEDKSRMGIFAGGVPGSVDGMFEAHKKYGKLLWFDLLQPAINLAAKGYQITQKEANNLNEEKFNFAKHCSQIPAFISMSKPWEPGDWLIQRDLARTLGKIAESGRNGFYAGGTAALIEHEMQQQNGLITKEDLLNYHSVWRKPMELDYKDLHLITMAPPSSGGVILGQLFKTIAAYPLKSYGFHSAAAIHLVAEAERRAFADRSKHLGDPDFWKVPVSGLLDSLYIVERMKTFDTKKASPSKDIPAGTPKESEQTTHYCIVDRFNNAVSVTTTLNDSYGSRVVIPGAGFIMNNEMDDFSAKPGAVNLYGAIGGAANAIKPSKRPLSSMTPTIVTRKGKLWMVVGTPGGTTIPTSVFQTIVNVYEFDMPLLDAVHAKRFHHQWNPDAISVEDNALPEAIVTELEGMGHTLIFRGGIGLVEAILVGADGKKEGVADNRGDDTARGY